MPFMIFIIWSRNDARHGMLGHHMRDGLRVQGWIPSNAVGSSRADVNPLALGDNYYSNFQCL